MNMLFGLLQPDEGEIWIGGQKVDFDRLWTPSIWASGWSTRHRKLVSAHSVIENIILGHPRAGRS